MLYKFVFLITWIPSLEVMDLTGEMSKMICRVLTRAMKQQLVYWTIGAYYN